MTRAAVLALCAALCAAPARAGFQTADEGSSSAQFLKLGGGARAEGMGEAYTAMPTEADALYWNPAALQRVSHHSFTFMHQSLPAAINYEFLGYGQKVGSSAGLGASIQYLSQPSIDQTDSSGFSTGSTFRPSDFAAAAGGAYALHGDDFGPFDGASFGATVKYIQSSITRTASTVGADVGFLSAPVFLLDREFRVAYVAQNLGGTLKYQQHGESLPTNLRLGASWALTKSWLLSADIDEPLDNIPYYALGTEYRIEAGEETSFSARCGVSTRAIGDSGSFSGFSFGLGARFRSYGVDYALAPLGALGLTNSLSLNYSF
jgi:hypothetical protein